MKYAYVFIIILSIYKSCDEIYFFHRMVIEIVLKNEIQFFFKSIYIFKRKKICLWASLGKN
jgi:hypothetical protein